MPEQKSLAKKQLEADGATGNSAALILAIRDF